MAKKISLVVAVVCIIFFGLYFLQNRANYRDMILSSSTVGGFNYGDNKLWKHRAEIHELDLTINCYGGLEVDVVYDGGVFDLRHGVDEPSRKYSLKDLFRESSRDSTVRYWLDFKNLTSSNVEEVGRGLADIFVKYKVGNRVIVESPCPNYLDALSKKNIFTSYWIPHFDLSNKSELADQVFAIRENLFKYRLNVISAHHLMLPLLKEFFTDCDVHIWTNGLIGEKDKDEIERFKNNPLFKVVLVDYDCLVL